jgi:hypothetical protein
MFHVGVFSAEGRPWVQGAQWGNLHNEELYNLCSSPNIRPQGREVNSKQRQWNREAVQSHSSNFSSIRVAKETTGAGIATGYELDDGRRRKLRPANVKNYFFSTQSRPVLGPTQNLNQWVSGYLAPWVKRPGRETDHLPPTSAEDKKTWINTSTPRTPSWYSV